MKQETRENLISMLNKTALIALIYSFIIFGLLLVNYYHLQTTVSPESPVLEALVQRLKENPGDEALLEEVRALRLLAQKALFINQWQINTGGVMLGAGILCAVISFFLAGMLKEKKAALEKPRERRRRLAFRVTGAFVLLLFFVPAFFLFNRSMEAVNPREKEEIPSSPETEVLAVREGTPYSEKARKEVTENWPSFRGPWGSGQADEGLRPPLHWDAGLNVAWKVSVPFPGFNSPVIWEGKVFLSGADYGKGLFACRYDGETGELIWEKEISGLPLDQFPETQADTGLAAPGTAVNKDALFVLFATGDLAALDHDGELLWSRNLGVPENHYGHSSSLILHNDLLIVQYDHEGGAGVMAFNIKDGELMWQTSRDVYTSWASPILADRGDHFNLILAANPFVSAYDPLTGKELWSQDILFGEVGPSPAYGNDLVFATNTGSSLVALDADTGELLWEMYDDLSNLVSPLATEKYVYMPTEYGVVTTYHIADGEVAWIHEFDEGFYSSPVTAGGYVYLTDREGTTWVLEEGDDYIPVSRNPLGEKVDTTPAFYGNAIYIRGLEKLYCLRQEESDG